MIALTGAINPATLTAAHQSSPEEPHEPATVVGIATMIKPGAGVVPQTRFVSVWHAVGVTDGWTRRLLRVKDLMDRAYAEPLGVPAMAELVFASADHFSRRFKQSFGETPHQYLLTRRMERAKALLRDSDLSVTEVCHAVGFASLGSFSTRFQELVGESPSAYRQRWLAIGDCVPARWIPMCVVLRHTRPLSKRSVSEKTPEAPDD